MQQSLLVNGLYLTVRTVSFFCTGGHWLYFQCMKNICFWLLLCCSFSAFAQSNYHTVANLPYYPEDTKQDAYQASQCVLDVYYPVGKKDVATVVWFHGGGITGGKKELPKALQEKGYIVVGVGYRLSPKVQSPAYIEDAAAAVAWVYKNISRFGGSSKKIVVSGHSAGGYLGMMITLDKKYLQAHDVDADSIAALVPFSGQAITHFTIRKENGIAEKQPTIDAMAPLYHVRPNAPPITLITGDRNKELLGRYEENAYLWRMLQLVGHKQVQLFELQGFDHGTMVEPAYPLLLQVLKSLQ